MDFEKARFDSKEFIEIQPARLRYFTASEARAQDMSKSLLVQPSRETCTVAE